MAVSERWGDSARDRADLDRYITREQPEPDYEPPEIEPVNCLRCGMPLELRDLAIHDHEECPA